MFMGASPAGNLAEPTGTRSGNHVLRQQQGRPHSRQALQQHDYLRSDQAHGVQRLTLPLPERKLPWLPTLSSLSLLVGKRWVVVSPEVQLSTAAVPAFFRLRLLRASIYPNAP